MDDLGITFAAINICKNHGSRTKKIDVSYQLISENECEMKMKHLPRYFRHQKVDNDRAPGPQKFQSRVKAYIQSKRSNIHKTTKQLSFIG